MKLIFRGWDREVKEHVHELTPVQFKNNGYKPGSKGSVDWHSAKTAFAKAEGLSLTGNFLVEINMEPKELGNWLSIYAKEQPEKALVIIAQAQAEALIALTKLNAE